jgi:hypothetical protein
MRERVRAICAGKCLSRNPLVHPESLSTASPGRAFLALFQNDRSLFTEYWISFGACCKAPGPLQNRTMFCKKETYYFEKEPK